MQDNVPTHTSKYSKGFLEPHRLHILIIKYWPANSPDLNPIENFSAIIKRRIYANGPQYNLFGAMWNEIKIACSSVTPDKMRLLIKSVDKRLIDVLQTSRKKVYK